MRKLMTVAALALAVALATWFTLGAIASAAGGPSAAVVRAQHGQAATTSQGARAGSRSAQNVSDPKGSEAENGPESESENGAAAEGDTHEDPQGQGVNHECPPTSDTANGEKP